MRNRQYLTVSLIRDKKRQEETRSVKKRQEPTRSDKNRQEATRSVKNQIYLVYGINKDKYIKLKAYIKYFNK
jgi:hypothetical protein